MTSSTTPKYYVELALENLSASSDIFNPSASLFEVLNTIALAKKDTSVGGLILNTSSLYASRSDLWELRKALEDFKTSGKKIIAFIERPDFDMYALVTLADRIVMDSQGTLNFDGYVVGRGYFKHTLEKLGVGFRELRYLTYKSAAESYSRDSFSPADREQYDAYLDSIFAATKASIINDRNIPEEQFNNLLDNNFLISPQEAKKCNLVDYLGREDAIERAINELSKNEMMIQVYGDMRLSLFQKNTNVLIAATAAYKAPSTQQDVWSEPPHIAIVYANGSTSLDGGMNARLLAKIIDQLGNDNKVKGIILRVNSPGGDAIAADYIAEAVKKAKEQKPVYVSMGSVAGSGGYWVSMFGSKIYATPYTITGSIGVIASWFYDAGLNGKLGLSMDLLKRGSHADLQAGLLLPYRDLNAQEIEEYHQWILELYDDFVSKVAEGRNMSKDRVEHLAQGRIYAGNDAMNNGLIDGIQNLTSVVHELKAALKLPEDVEVVIDEYPYPNPFAAFLSMINQTTLPKSKLTLHMIRFIEDLQNPSFTPLSMYSFSEIVSSRVASNGTVQVFMPLEALEVLQGDTLQEKGLFGEKR
jgi:protease-4